LINVFEIFNTYLKWFVLCAIYITWEQQRTKQYNEVESIKI